MLVSFNWLKQYVDIKETPEQVAELLTMHSVEVEEVNKQAELLDKVVVGKIKAIRKHSNADKLFLVDTEIGNGEAVQIVCGGTNLKEDMFVAVAKVGAMIKWHGEGEPVKLEKAKIRGEYSEGMICLDSEIGLGDNVGTEIMNMKDFTDKEMQVGQKLEDLLGLDDVVFEIDNKSLTHRSDLFSHVGIAREFAAITNRKLKLPKTSKIKTKNTHKLNIQVENFEDTKRYMMVVLDNIEIKPSPEWMQKRLQAVGVKVINNVVDISNYLMLEYGNPNHTFDYDKVAGHLFRIRRAKKGEKMFTLDDVEQKLDENSLIIEDEEKITDLAGTMGGQESEISDSTKTVALEVANFDKVLIRKNANRLGIRTEAVVRFEKGLGLDLCEQALYRGIELLKEHAGAVVTSKIYDERKLKLDEKEIELDSDYLNQLIGLEISNKQVVKILESLELKVKGKRDKLVVTIPLFRTDLDNQEDLIEEVARIYGYDNIPLTPLADNLEPVKYLDDLKWGDWIVAKLSGWGFSEVMNYSFYGDKEINNCSLSPDQHVQLANPLSEEQKYLRTTLLPGLLNNVEKNLNNNFDNIKLFEVGHIYYSDLELKMLAGVLVGKKQDVYYEAKGIVESLLKNLNIDFEIKPITKREERKNYYWQMFEAKADAEILVNNKIIGTLSLVNKKVLNNFGIDKNQVAFFNFDLKKLSELANTNTKYKALSKYPEVDIDLAIIVDKKYDWEYIKTEIKKSNKLIKSIELFDIYEGNKIEQGKRSLAMHLLFQDKNKTLEMKEVEKFRDDIMKKLNNKFKAIIRDK